MQPSRSATARGSAAKGARAKGMVQDEKTRRRAEKQKHQAKLHASSERLRAKSELCRQHGVGCRHCKGTCLIHFRPLLGDVRKWREEFRNLPDEDARDVSISWMFCEAPRELTRRQKQAVALVECDASSEEVAFKTSSEDDNAKANAFQTSSEDDASANDAKTNVFQTSSSDSDGLDVGVVGCSSSSAKAPPMKDARAFSARNSRYAIGIGIGSSRGEIDGRRLPSVRGPDGMPLKADSALSSCLTFLWRAMLLVYCSIEILLINRVRVVGPSDFQRA